MFSYTLYLVPQLLENLHIFTGFFCYSLFLKICPKTVKLQKKTAHLQEKLGKHSG